MSIRPRYGLGIDLGGTNFSVGVFSRSGKLLSHAVSQTPVTESPDDIADALGGVARAELGRYKAAPGSVVAVGVGFPGPVDPVAGVVRKAPNLPCLAGYPLADALSSRLDGLPAVIQNDAYCATLAEFRWGAGKEAQNMVLLTLGTGIGGGVVLGGQVLRGPRQILGEIGHMILDPHGRKCGCGNFGCFEALAAKQAIIDMAAAAIQSGADTLLSRLVGDDQSKLTPQVVSEAARAGDQTAIGIYERVGFLVGLALCNCIVLTDPDVIVLGGGIAAAGEILFGPVRRTVRARSLISGFDVSRIVPAKFGDLAGLYGAGALAWERA